MTSTLQHANRNETLSSTRNDRETYMFWKVYIHTHLYTPCTLTNVLANTPYIHTSSQTPHMHHTSDQSGSRVIIRTTLQFGIPYSQCTKGFTGVHIVCAFGVKHWKSTHTTSSTAHGEIQHAPNHNVFLAPSMF